MLQRRDPCNHGVVTTWPSEVGKDRSDTYSGNSLRGGGSGLAHPKSGRRKADFIEQDREAVGSGQRRRELQVSGS